MNPADEPSGLMPAGAGGTPPIRHNSREHFEALLDAMVARPDERSRIAAQIERDFGEVRAVMVLDMSGFSITTQCHGIACFLLMIHQLRAVARPAVEMAGGLVVKAEADNLYCMFEDVPQAVAAAREINARLEQVPPVYPDSPPISVATGIGYGHILNIDEKDMFGDELNLASKLGEDVAEPGQILLTEAASARARALGIKTRECGRDTHASSLVLARFELR